MSDVLTENVLFSSKTDFFDLHIFVPGFVSLDKFFYQMSVEFELVTVLPEPVLPTVSDLNMYY